MNQFEQDVINRATVKLAEASSKGIATGSLYNDIENGALAGGIGGGLLSAAAGYFNGGIPSALTHGIEGGLGGATVGALGGGVNRLLKRIGGAERISPKHYQYLVNTVGPEKANDLINRGTFAGNVVPAAKGGAIVGSALVGIPSMVGGAFVGGMEGGPGGALVGGTLGGIGGGLLGGAAGGMYGASSGVSNYLTGSIRQKIFPNNVLDNPGKVRGLGE